MIDLLVTDLIAFTREGVRAAGIESLEDVRTARAQLVGLSPDVAAANRRLKRFLNERLYRHHRIERMRDKYRRVLIALFTRYHENPLLLPESQRRQQADEGISRLIADYIAGMTDRYAVDEYRRLFDPDTKI